MPEQDKKERGIVGESSVTPSSDEAIQAKIRSISRGLHGLPETDIVLEDDNLEPIPVVSGKEIDEQLASRSDLVQISDLSHDHSALGFTIRAERLVKKQLLKKAA